MKHSKPTARMSDNSPHPMRILEIEVDAPLMARLKRGGYIELEYYRQISGEPGAETVTMCLKFSPEATKTLVHFAKVMFDKGLVVLAEPASKAFTH
ncbi:MAG: hypothetical protein LBH31_08575 [Burkholderiaceae bacterium]|jgi:hypothetical protein|nr:hypothetical protein [Burkholderiaceae bacterium]